LDGVLANTIAACCKIINDRHSTHFQASSFVHWKAWEIANISRDEFFRSLDEAWFDWRTIPPTEERLAEKVEKLRQLSNVDIVTSRSLETVASAKSWLKDQGIKFNSFVRTDSGMDKAGLGYDLFIDDSPELMSALSSKPDRYGILYAQPWNQELPTLPRICRVDSWNQIPQLVCKLLKVK
jgi:5'(3')-deoxyribonucleotidase